MSPSTVWAVIPGSVTVEQFLSTQSFRDKCLLRAWTPSPQSSAPGVGCEREKRPERVGPGMGVCLRGIYKGVGTIQ